MAAEWWDDDPELLSETLSMLAEWDRSSHSPGPESLRSGGSSSPVTSSSQRSSFDGSSYSDAPVVIGPMRNLSRERKKEEAAQLRAEIWRLEGQLRALGVGKYSKQTTTTTEDLVVWRAMAEGQLEARREAERMNAKLRRMTAEQARVAQQLIGLIQKAEHARRKGFTIPGLFTVEIPREMVERVTREHQFRRLDMLCLHWRSAFALCGRFDVDAQPFIDLRVVQRDGKGAIVDLFASSAAPFSVSRVKQVMWQHFLEPRYEGGGQTFAQTSETFADRVAADYTIMNVHGRSNGRYVTGRLVDGFGRPMFITHAYSESDRNGTESSAYAVGLDQDSWVRIVDARELFGPQVGGPSSTGPMTMIQNVRRVRVTLLGECGPAQTQEITQFVHNVLEVEALWARQSLSNLLMQPRAIVDIS